MSYWPANAWPLTMSLSGVTLSALKTCSSTIGPAGLDSTWAKVWSFATFSLKTTVVSSGVSTLSRLASSDAGPFGSLIFFWRSKVNLTSEEVRSWPLANVRPDLSFTVYSFGEVNSALSAMSGLTSGLPYGEFRRNGYTWFMTANEPLSYEPAGSIEVILSVVPMVSAPPPPPEPLLLPEQPASTSAVAANAADTASRRRPPLDADLISVYLFLVWGSPSGRGIRVPHRRLA